MGMLIRTFIFKKFKLCISGLSWAFEDFANSSVKNTSSVQRKGADYAARALKSMIQGLGQIFQLFLKIWVMKVIAESMVKKLFVDFLGGKIGF